MLVLLWVFQTVCFRSVYSRVRVNQVKKCASSIEENINSNNITTLVENLAEQNDVMIYVYDTTDSTVRPVYSTDKSFMKIMIYDSSSSSSNDSNSGSSSKVPAVPIKIHLTKNLQITVHQIKIPIATKVIATVQLLTDSMYHLALIS